MSQNDLCILLCECDGHVCCIGGMTLCDDVPIFTRKIRAAVHETSILSHSCVTIDKICVLCMSFICIIAVTYHVCRSLLG